MITRSNRRMVGCVTVALYALVAAAVGPEYPWVGGFFGCISAYRAWRLYRDW